MVVTLPPQKPPTAATSFAIGLFNAAHKSIQENQHETFFVSLQALSRIVEPYVNGRRDYLGSFDSFLNYLLDQFAAVVKAAAKSPNEYMVMNAVSFIGATGVQALEIGRGPNPPVQKYPGSHPAFPHWQALLGECFDLTHQLTRSIAASEALTQLSRLAMKAIDLGYGENVFLTFPAELRRIYAVCLADRGAYHISLAGQCMRSLMNVWAYCLASYKPVLAGTGKQLCETAKDMALAFQAVEKSPSHDLRDPVMTLISKLAEEQITLQDIALFVLTRPVTERWERSSAVKEFRQLLDAAVELLKDALAKDSLFVQQYGDAFYDFAILIFVALPDQWNQPEVAAERYFGVNPPDVRESFETELAATVKDLIPLCHRAHTMGLDWQQQLFSIIGIAAAIYADTGRESARSLALEAILQYRDLVYAEDESDRRVSDDDWDYLQLVSVWARHLLKETRLADDLVDAVAHRRPFSFGILESSGKSGWGHYGYPSVHFGADFGIPNPRNIRHRLSDSVQRKVRQWQDRLMNAKELSETSEMVEKIRTPIWERIIEKRKKEKRPPRTSEGGASGKRTPDIG